MGKNKDKKIKQEGSTFSPRVDDDQLGENAPGMDTENDIYKKEHHKKKK